MIYFTSDLHLNHDREFIYKPRGFLNIEEMNKSIEYNWNNKINYGDEVYVLGDLMLGDNSIGMEILNRLQGNIHIIRGNHDTDARIKLYKTLPNVVEICEGKFLEIKGYHFYLTHFPCITTNLEKESLKQTTLNLFGHTHSKDKFYMDIPYLYNVALDAHNCFPVSFDKIITDMKNKIYECKEFL